MITVREYIQSLRESGLGLYQALDKLDLAAMRDGYDGAVYYHILCDVYADWEYREKAKRKPRPASKLSSQDWQSLQERYDYRCFYCGKRKERLTKDHIVPISRNGEDTIDNIVPACRCCNSRKNSRPIEIFKSGVTVKLL